MTLLKDILSTRWPWIPLILSPTFSFLVLAAAPFSSMLRMMTDLICLSQASVIPTPVDPFVSSTTYSSGFATALLILRASATSFFVLLISKN